MILAAVFCFATAAVNAQTYVVDLERSLQFTIPGCFTNNGHPYVLYGTYNPDDSFSYSIYQSDFITHVLDINDNVSICFFYDGDSNTVGYGCETSGVTQNLFNSDDDFEYIIRENSDQSLRLKSTNGSTLWSFDAQEGYSCSFQFLKLDNKYYLIIREYDGNVGYIYHLYFISQTDGLTEVETELPITAFPTMPTRGQQITVELGEGNNAKEITVVNSLGQVVKRVSVEEGQREVTIPTKDFGSGLNVVNTRTEQGQGSCKIIVR